MLSNQMIKIIKLCSAYDIKVSYEQILKLCSIDSEDFDRLVSYFSKCAEEKRRFFLAVFIYEDFIEYYAFEEILKLISLIDINYIENIKLILSYEDITKMPKLIEYLNAYYLISSNQISGLSSEKFNQILNILPEASDVYTNDELIEFLLERIESAYDYYVVNEDVLYLEDGGEDLLRTIDMHYKLRRKNKKYNTATLVRKLKKKDLIEPKGKIIEVDFTKEQK